jgi:branched-chain amino acid transport system permease protein
LVQRCLVKSWLGLAWQSIREDEIASRAMGNHTPKLKIIAFTLGAAYCGLAGSLYAPFMGGVSPYDFGFLPSLFVVTMLMVGGVGTIRGAVVGATILSLLPELFRFVQEYRNLIYGGLLVFVMLYQPSGILGEGSFVWSMLSRLPRRWRQAVTAPLGINSPSAQNPCSLVVQEVSIDFGGLRALDRVSLRVDSGEIVGFIGPNGAGKTTLFNVICGFYEPQAGSVLPTRSPTVVSAEHFR